MSEELENSLQQAVETYLNDRLAAIQEQISRLQTEFSEALARLRESSNSESLDGSALSASIFAHLQTARGQKLTGVAVTTAAPADARAINRSVAEIERQQSQTDVLKSLLTNSVQFAERVALFVVKNEQAIGWRVCEAGDPGNLELIGGVSLPLSAETLLGRAADSRSSWAGASDPNSQDRLLIDQLGGDPRSMIAVPLVARGKVVAILYADSASSGPDAINLDAIEILARVAAMVVSLASVARAAQPSEPAPPPEEQPTMPTAVATVEAPPEPEQTYTPEIEPQPTEAFAEPPATQTVEEVVGVSEPPTTEVVAEAETIEPTAEVVAESEPQAIEAVATHPGETAPVEEVAPETRIETEAPQAMPEVEPATLEPAPTAAPQIEAEPAVQPPASSSPGFVSQYAAPLGSSRRFGLTEPDLPIEVGEEERRLHNDARRFARLLVSEIKLYNEPKVKEGRSNGDLYDRLREDIDRSRQMYDKRVAPPVAARHDYFHQELVNTLAEGDPAKLGQSYPGAVLSANR
ncbi:MAG TPA: GAF domain-containing protein [Pyrinomonadaceae bacterium]